MAVVSGARVQAGIAHELAQLKRAQAAGKAYNRFDRSADQAARRCFGLFGYDREWRQLRSSDGLEHVIRQWGSLSGDERLLMRISTEQTSAPFLSG